VTLELVARSEEAYARAQRFNSLALSNYADYGPLLEFLSRRRDGDPATAAAAAASLLELRRHQEMAKSLCSTLLRLIQSLEEEKAGCQRRHRPSTPPVEMASAAVAREPGDMPPSPAGVPISPAGLPFISLAAELAEDMSAWLPRSPGAPPSPPLASASWRPGLTLTNASLGSSLDGVASGPSSSTPAEVAMLETGLEVEMPWELERSSDMKSATDGIQSWRCQSFQDECVAEAIVRESDRAPTSASVSLALVETEMEEAGQVHEGVVEVHDEQNNFERKQVSEEYEGVEHMAKTERRGETKQEQEDQDEKEEGEDQVEEHDREKQFNEDDLVAEDEAAPPPPRSAAAWEAALEVDKAHAEIPPPPPRSTTSWQAAAKLDAAGHVAQPSCSATAWEAEVEAEADPAYVPTPCSAAAGEAEAGIGLTGVAAAMHQLSSDEDEEKVEDDESATLPTMRFSPVVEDEEQDEDDESATLPTMCFLPVYADEDATFPVVAGPRPPCAAAAWEAEAGVALQGAAATAQQHSSDEEFGTEIEEEEIAWEEKPRPHSASPLSAPASQGADLELRRDFAAMLDSITAGETAQEGSPVFLHVYDVSKHTGVQWLNAVFAHRSSPLKFGGIFHVGVEVHGKEWFFGQSKEGTGVTWMPPRSERDHHFRESVALPHTQLTPEAVSAVIRTMMGEYTGKSYELLRRNCCHFADDFCHRLGVGQIPAWTYRLASIGGSAAHMFSGIEERASVTHLSRSVAGSVVGSALTPALHAPTQPALPPPRVGSARDIGARDARPL